MALHFENSRNSFHQKKMLSCFALLEPKVIKDTIKDYEKKLNCQGSVCNLEGTIWIFWKSNIKCSMMAVTS